MTQVDIMPEWPFHGAACPNCGSKKSWNFHTRHENFFRGNGVEVDKSDYYCFCTTCRHFFCQQSGYGHGEDGPHFLPWKLSELGNSAMGESFERFRTTGKGTVDE